MLKTESGRGYRLLGGWTVRQPSAAAQPSEAAPFPVPDAQPSGVQFPAPAFGLIGRGGVVRELQDLLSAYRAVTLTGPGGIGKTTLALEVARSLLGDFDGAGWFVELVSLSDPGLVPSAVAGVLGLKLSGEAASPDAIARAIGERRTLLVLDNCEHVVETAARLAETIVRRCPHATVLATSRESLRTDGEYVYRVPPLEVPLEGEEEPSRILGHSAVELFIARARASDADSSSYAEHVAAIAAICRHLDGIPLAIEFAAARAATLGLAEVASHLDDRFRFLTAGRRTALPRHQTLRAVLDWSYELLPEAEQRLLQNLAILVGDFSLEAALAVAGDLPAPLVVDELANLLAKSLVVSDLRNEVAQYRLLETTRLYALEKLRDSGDYRRAAQRHAEYYRDIFAPAEAESESRPQAEWLATYARHIDNVRSALDWAFSSNGDPQVGVTLTIAAVPLWVQLSLLDECHDRVERALASLDAITADTARVCSYPLRLAGR
jgi:predicted ATPase